MGCDKITLVNDQEENKDNYVRILKKHFSVIDTGEMGTGKTYVLLYVAKLLKLKLFIVCINSMVSVWENLSEEYGIESIVISNTALRGVKGIFKHPYLHMVEEKVKATKKFKKLIDEGYIMGLDESQFAKNKDAAQAIACVAFSRVIRKKFEKYYNYHEDQKFPKIGKGRSRIALLSRTPTANAKKDLVQMLRLAGVIKHPTLLKNTKNGYISTGFEELKEYCMKIDPVKTTKLTRWTSLNIRNSLENMAKLYEHVLKNEIGTTMEDKTNKINIMNCFYEISEEDMYKLRNAKKDFSKANKAIEKGVRAKKASTRFNVYSWQKTIENVKVNLFIRIIKKILKENPNRKVVLYMWTKQALINVHKALKKYGTSLINGAVPKGKVRDDIIDKFQEPNTEIRVLCTHPKILGEGRDLGDNHGDYPRTGLLSPHFEYLPQHQCPGRFARMSKSVADFIIVYIDGLNGELNIYMSLNDKTAGMRIVIKSKSPIKFLTDYPIVYERNIKKKNKKRNCYSYREASKEKFRETKIHKS